MSGPFLYVVEGGSAFAATVREAAASAISEHALLTTQAHGGIVASTDGRLTDARDPKAHKGTHAAGGTDALAPADIGAIPTSAKGAVNGVAELDAAALLFLSRLPNHKARHAAGGADALSPADIGAPPNARTVSTSEPLTGGGDLSANRTIGLLDVTGLTPGTYERATVTVDAKGRVTAVAVGAAGSVADASSTAKGASLLDRDPLVATEPRAVGQNSLVLETHIGGLDVEWAGPNALNVQRGSAWIPGLSRVLNVPAIISKSALTFTANTWYYLYLFDNAGAPDVEISTVAPAAPYKGSARIKGGATPDNTRRYLGAARSNGAATPGLFNFLRQGRLVKYRENTTGTPFRVLAGGVATTSASVSLAALVPPTTRVGIVKLQNTGSDRSPSFGTPDGMGAIVGTVFSVAPGNELSEPFPLGAAQELFYNYAVAPTSGGAFVDVLGYEEQR